MAKQSLADFSLSDDENSFFGVENNDKPTSVIEKIVKEVKSKDVQENEDDEEHETPTKLEDKGKAKGKKEEEDEELEEDVDFTFGEESTPTSKENTTPKPSKEELEKTKKAKEAAKRKEEVEDEEEEVDKGKQKPEKATSKASKKGETEEDNEEGEEDFKDDEEKTFTSLARDLQDRGFFANNEIKKNQKLDEESFFEAIDAEVESRVEETFESFFEDISEDGKKFLKFLKGGGNSHDYINHLLPPFDFSKFDENNKDHVARVIKYHLVNNEKLDGEELEDRMQYLKDGGKEKEWAVKWNTKAQKDHEGKVALVQKTLADKAKADEEEAKEFNNELKETLEKLQTIGDAELSKEDKKALHDYMTKPTVKVGKNKFIPQVNADIAKVLTARSKEDKKNFIILAKLLKSKFDFSDIVVEKETETLKKAQSRVRTARATGRVGGNNGGSSPRVKSLSDFID